MSYSAFVSSAAAAASAGGGLRGFFGPAAAGAGAAAGRPRRFVGDGMDDADRHACVLVCVCEY